MARKPVVPTDPLAFAETFIRVPDLQSKRIGRIPLHGGQVAVLRALGEHDGAGLRRIRELLLHWFRQSGKSTLDAILALYGLTADPFHTDRLVVLAATDEEQGLRVFHAARRMAARHPSLSGQIRFLSKEAVYVSDDGNGHRSEHLLRVLASGDVRGAHGLTPSLTIIDEVWTQDDYDLIEPLTQSPARVCPLTVYSSYSGLRSQQRPGVPLYDLLQRARAGDDASFHYSYMGKAQWFTVPWVTAEWIARLRRQLGAAPARFIRLVENRVAPADDAFVTDDELAAAMDPAWIEPTHGAPGTLYVGGADLGLMRAWSGVVVGHVDAGGVFVVDALRSWKASTGRPVSLEAVEAEILTLAARFPLAPPRDGAGGFRMDPWQGALLAERLERHGVPVVLEPITAARVDQLVTRLKGAFSGRLLRFGGHLVELREQLEGLTVTEGKARGLLRFQADGKAAGPARFTDLVFALALAVEAAGTALGRDVLPLTSCNREQSGLPSGNCFLFAEAGDYSAAIYSSDLCCQTCPGFRHVTDRWREDPHGCDLRRFRWVHCGTSEYIERRRESRGWSQLRRNEDGRGGELIPGL